MDCGPTGLLSERQAADGRGMKLIDFCLHPSAQLAKLDPTAVAALRIYTTAAFASINSPLRDLDRKARGELRAVGARDCATANAEVTLWRGLKNVDIVQTFLDEGGTELAPMSTTSDLSIAVRYSVGEQSLLLRLLTRSSMEGEAEVLYPPLTYLQPVGVESSIELGGLTFRVLTVVPRI